MLAGSVSRRRFPAGPPGRCRHGAARGSRPRPATPSRRVLTSSRSIADGQAVIAGRALPGDRVRVLDGETPIGEVSADARGEWVLVPETPIAPGDRQLAVEATIRRRTGRRRGPPLARYRRAVGCSPQRRPRAAMSGGTSALAVLLPGEPGAPARILQRPQRSRRRAETATLSLDTAEYGGPDQLVLSGNAEPGARLNIYAGGQLLGSAVADDAGKWVLRSAYRRPTGGIELRLDQLAADGSVARRVAAPFTVPAGTALRRRRDLCRRARQQPVADRPPCLWPGHALHRDLRGQPGHDPRSAPDLSGTGAEAAAAVIRPAGRARRGKGSVRGTGGPTGKVRARNATPALPAPPPA